MTDLSSGLDEAKLVETYTNTNSGVILDRSGQPAVGANWYLLSMKWYSRWQMYHGLVDRTGDTEDLQSPGEIDNSDILLEAEKYYCLGENTQSDRVLKPELTLDEDFKALPPNAWTVLSSRYGVKPGSIVPRFSIHQKGTLSTIEITLRELQLAVVLPGYILIPPKAIYVSRKLRVSGLYLQVKEILCSLKSANFSSSQELSIWELDTQSNYEVLKGKIDSREKSQLVEFPGGRLTVMEEDMDEAGLAAGQLLVAEVQGPGESWSFARISRRIKCEMCRKKFFSEGIRCNCRLVRFTQKTYCSSACFQAAASIHFCIKASLPSQPLQIPVKPAFPHSPKALERRKKACGLSNLGNTCYMNSGLQCLAHTADLTRVFLEDLHVGDINVDNPIGTGGRLVKAYASLLKEIWTSRDTSLGPWHFKRELGSFVPQFYGANQHDSHEVITYILDFLHEDLNRVVQKPILSEILTVGMSEMEVAERYWEMHLSRNRSWIVDFFHGQYRSEVTCPICLKSSLTFDPFVSLSVPFAAKQELHAISAYYLPYDFLAPIYTIRLRLPPRPSASQVLSTAAALIGKSEAQLGLFSVFSNTVVGRLKGNEPLKDQGSATLVLYEMPENVLETDIVFLQFSKTPGSLLYRKSYFTLPRLILLPENWTLYQVHLSVFSLLSQAENTGKSQESPDFDTNVEEKFEKWLQDDPTSLMYKLNVCNLKRDKSAKCDFCGKSKCDSCPLPISHDILLASMRLNSNSGVSLVLDAEIALSLYPFLPSIRRNEAHSSLESVREAEKQVSSRSYSLYDCLDFSAQGEQLDAENEVYCSHCKAHVPATKQMTIYRLPPVLIIHLKRFKTGRNGRQKDDRRVNFPLDGLDLRKYCRVSKLPAIYDLYAVSNHFGGLAGGHYTAFAKHEGQWFDLDDATVREIGPEAVVSSAAYVLFYRAVESLQ